MFGEVQWLILIIPALWESNAGGSPEVRNSRPAWTTWKNPISAKNTKISWAWWHTPVVPALWEAEVGGSPRVRSLRPAWPGQYGETLSLLKIKKLAGHGGTHL